MSRRTAASLTTFAVALSVCFCQALSTPTEGEDIDVGAPPTLAPGRAPPLPKAGPLAQPRPQDQVGLPAALTKSVIPPGSPLTPAVISLGAKLFSMAGSRVTARLPVRPAMTPRAPSPTAGQSRSALADALASATRQPF